MFANKTALIVEGDAHNLLAISALLKNLDIRYKRNTSGEQVIQQAHKMDPRPDFILLDLNLPRGNAFAICEALKFEAELQGIPVIALAESTGPWEKLPGIESCIFDGVLPKPFSERRVRAVLQNVLSVSL
ncbi:MAG: response regulator [Anaerolineae bacterium]|nr:response regulator [Anaerolineae bacterium]